MSRIETENNNPYFQMVIGTIGIILLGLGLIRYATQTSSVYALADSFTLFGFALVVSYIYSLERAAGMSNKFVWIQSGICILIIGGISAILYL